MKINSIYQKVLKVNTADYIPQYACNVLQKVILFLNFSILNIVYFGRCQEFEQP